MEIMAEDWVRLQLGMASSNRCIMVIIQTNPFSAMGNSPASPETERVAQFRLKPDISFKNLS